LVIIIIIIIIIIPKLITRTYVSINVSKSLKMLTMILGLKTIS